MHVQSPSSVVTVVCPLASISQLKVRCNQEEKLRTELARWSTAEHDLKEKEKSVWLLKVSMLFVVS